MSEYKLALPAGLEPATYWLTSDLGVSHSALSLGTTMYRLYQIAQPLAATIELERNKLALGDGIEPP